MRIEKPKCPKCSAQIGVWTLVEFSRKRGGICPSCKTELDTTRSGWGYSILCFVPGVFALITYRENFFLGVLGILGVVVASYFYYVNMEISAR